MKTVKRVLNHVSVALCLGLMVIAILDGFNPMMSFLTSKPSKIFIFATCAVCVANAVISFILMLDSPSDNRR